MTKFKTVDLTEEFFLKFYADDNEWTLDDGVLSYVGDDQVIDLVIVAGLALLDNGHPVAISGVMTDGEILYAMGDHTINIALHCFTFSRFAKRSIDVIKQYSVVTTADKDIAGSDAFLMRAGFIKNSEGVYQWQAS